MKGTEYRRKVLPYPRGLKEDTQLNEIMIDKLRLLESFNNISTNYSLGWGTLLGWARNGGIIPWDDDIDILLPAHEYKRLSKLYPDRFYWYRGTLRYSDPTACEFTLTKLDPNSKDGWVDNYIDVFLLMNPVPSKVKNKLYRMVYCDLCNFKKSTWKWRLKNIGWYLTRFMNDWRYEREINKLASNVSMELPLSTCFLFGPDFIINKPFHLQYAQLEGVECLALDWEYMDEVLSDNYGDWRSPRLKTPHKCVYKLKGTEELIDFKVNIVEGEYRDLTILYNLTVKGVTSFRKSTTGYYFFIPEYIEDEVHSKLEEYGCTSILPIVYHKWIGFE